MEPKMTIILNGKVLNIIEEPTDFLGLDIKQLDIDDSNLKVNEVLSSSQNYFIRSKRMIGNILLDFTGAGNYSVFFYDGEGELKGRHYALNNKVGFIITTQHKKILMVPYGSKQ
jgi:hypothetical protein